MNISIDNNNYRIYDKVFFLTAMNLPYEGGGFKLCPKAICDDDILDICILDSIPKLKIFTLLTTAYSGNHIKFKGVNLKKCRKIDIRTKVPIAVHVDGEHFGYEQSINIYVNECKLKIIV